MSTTRTLKTCAFAVLVSVACFTQVNAADYKIDTNGMHGYVHFTVSHMGFSMIGGSFNSFEGTFSWDKDNPSASSAMVTVNTASIDTNHEARDKHLSSADFLNVEKFPTAMFKSTSYQGDASGGKLMGDFTLNGVTKPITINVSAVGEGKDPWGGYRAGFTGEAKLNGADYGYTSQMFPKEINIYLSVEGIKQ